MLRHNSKAYRYWLERKNVSGEGVTVFCMLNPSVADQVRSDPTMTRCSDFSVRWDTAQLVIVNLFAARSTDPDEMLELDDAVGPRNDAYIQAACNLVKLRGGKFVCGWGNHSMARARQDDVLRIIKKCRVEPLALALNKDGSPRHPLYIGGDTEPFPYRP